MVEGFMALPLEVLVRFGRWDDSARRSRTTIRSTCRSRAHSIKAPAPPPSPRKATPAKARSRADNSSPNAPSLVPEDAFRGNNTAQSIVAVAPRMLEGEILIAEGKFDEGLAEAALRARKLEDAMKYDEPPGWMIPLRHAIGAALMRAKRSNKPRQVYRDDLKRLPDNGWSLHGLAESLRAQKKERR